jgi:hypothetical protein
VDAGFGHLGKPLAELAIEFLEVAKAAAEEKALLDEVERAFVFLFDLAGSTRQAFGK